MLFATTFLFGALTSPAAGQRPESVEPQLAIPTNRPLKDLMADKSAVVLQSYTFDQGGSADAQGWVALDRTADFRPFIHVDDHLPALSGSKSLWCGAIANTDDPATNDWFLSGYGNNWDQSWVSRAFTTTSPDSTTFSCQIQWDLFDINGGYDYLRFEYRIDSGPWIIERLYANNSGAENLRISSLLPVGSTIMYRFVFKSDEFNSNADGMITIPGAFLVDDLLVVNGPANILSSEDFESEPIGAIITNSGDWHAESAPGFGLYANMFTGSIVRQDDPATFNDSHFWSFFSGSPDTYNCNEPYTAVPTGGASYPNILSNEIQSPWISVTQTLEATSIRVDYDAYLDSPYEVGNYSAYYRVEILYRDLSGQFWGSQETPAYFGTNAAWIQLGHQFILPAGTSEIQIVFWVGEVLDSPCHRQAPFIDNVVISQTGAITVTALSSTGPGSLYWAIDQANTQPGLDVIEFDLPSNDWIILDSPLPPITEAVHIKGYTATGSTPNTLTGANDAVIIARLRDDYGGGAPALDIQADDCVIEGLAFDGFSNGDVRIAGNNNTVRGCWFGSNPDGSYMSSIVGSRILLPGAGGGSPAHTGNTIGGNVPADHNVVGNCTGGAIVAFDNDSLTVRGNLIGLRPDGQTAAGSSHGVELTDCLLAEIRGNVISGNNRSTFSTGISISRGGDHRIRSNIIGLNGTQTQAVPNSFAGIDYEGSIGQTYIGGSSSSGNVIAGNGGPGIRLLGDGKVLVYNNKIGTNSGETATSLGNGGDGILMDQAFFLEVEIGRPTGGNVIAHNDGAGIKVGQYMNDFFQISRNSIHRNDGLEIDLTLWTGSPLPAPVITEAVVDAVFSLRTSGTLDAEPDVTYALELFVSPYCFPPNQPDAKDYIDTIYLTTDGTGHAEFTSYAGTYIYPNDVVTAITSRSEGYGSSAVGDCFKTINTPQGADVAVAMPIENGRNWPVTATFDLVTTEGNTGVAYADDCGSAPAGYQILGYYEVSTTAEYSQNVTFCFDYDEQDILTGSESGMMVLQGIDDPGDPFLDITGGHDLANDTICGVISSLEPWPGRCLAIVAPLVASAVPDIPVAFRLLPNFPNPFNPSTTIGFELPRAADRVTVDVYDVSGRRVRRLHSGSTQSGRTELVWNGTDDVGRSVVSGVYLVQIVNGEQRLSQRVLLLK